MRKMMSKHICKYCKQDVKVLIDGSSMYCSECDQFKEDDEVLEMPDKFDNALMDSAFIWAGLATCNRRQVGCVIAKDSRILSTGYNGTISGTNNCCEEPICLYCQHNSDKCKCSISFGQEIRTKETVLHAEQNALMFALKNGISTDKATIYCTDAPCITCSKLIAQAGIAEVFYARDYHDTQGIDLLSSVGIKVQKLEK